MEGLQLSNQYKMKEELEVWKRTHLLHIMSSVPKKVAQATKPRSEIARLDLCVGSERVLCWMCRTPASSSPKSTWLHKGVKQSLFREEDAHSRSARSGRCARRGPRRADEDPCGGNLSVHDDEVSDELDEDAGNASTWRS